MNAYKGVTPTTVEFNDSLGNQDYTESTIGQQQADTTGKDMDDSEYNYGTILVCKGYINGKVHPCTGTEALTRPYGP
jgi:hypothetical protein